MHGVLAAMAGMVRAGEQTVPQADDRPLVAASMFGVTTPAVETARARLAGLGYEVLVFHATGSGGRALEALAAAGLPLRRMDTHLNDPEFATAMADTLHQMITNGS